MAIVTRPATVFEDVDTMVGPKRPDANAAGLELPHSAARLALTTSNCGPHASSSMSRLIEPASQNKQRGGGQIAPAHASTRSARNVFHRLGNPSGPSISKCVGP